MSLFDTVIKYSIDTSSIIKVENFYVASKKTMVIKLLIKLITNDKLKMSNLVWIELEDKIKDAHKIPSWLKPYKNIVIKSSTEIENMATEISIQYPKLSPGTPSRPYRADSSVIALARYVNKNDGNCTIISEEQSRSTASVLDKIPDVCRELQIDCINLDKLIEIEHKNN